MPRNYRIYAATLVVTIAIVTGIFAFPPLTSGGGNGRAGVSEAEFEALVVQELSYCREQPEAMDCQCFARMSGTVLASNAPRYARARYADKQELARSQASSSC